MKTLLPLLAVVALSLSASAQNLTKVLTNGITFVTAGATSNALTTAWTEIKNHQEVAVSYRQIWTATNAAGASTSTLTLGGSSVPSNFVAIATIVRAVPSTLATLTNNIGTNVYIGSFRYFAVIDFSNGATNSTVTNMSPQGVNGVISLQFKDARSEY